MSSINPLIHDYDGLIFRFCLFDNFSRSFCPFYSSYQLKSGIRHRNRSTEISLPELMTIVVEFHYSHYTSFKAFYLEYVFPILKPLFPKLPTYAHFVALMPRTMIPLWYCLTTLFHPCTAISFVDSTVIKVCHIKRIFNHAVFRGLAKRGKNTMGWFYGFKLHLVISDQGDILSWLLTTGNLDDRKPLGHLTKGLFGKLFGDKGYISSSWVNFLAQQGLQLITGIRSNMKNKFMPLMDKVYLRKRCLIETINDWLKNECHIEHSRHRSPVNFLVNLISGLVAYQLHPKKPSLNLTNSELRLLPAVC